MTMIEFLKEHDVPVNSVIRAVQHINDNRKSDTQYRSLISEMTGLTVDDNGPVLRLIYLYLVQEAIRAYMDPFTDEDNVARMYMTARTAAYEQLKEREWIYRSSMTETGETKKKGRKGGKKEQAIELWKQECNITRTRKEWIARLVEKVGLTAGGASTYYATLKRGEWA